MTPPADDQAQAPKKSRVVNANTAILGALSLLVTICTATLQHYNGEGTAEIKRLHAASSEKLDKLLESQTEMRSDIKVLQIQREEIKDIKVFMAKLEERLHAVETKGK